jgi:hypothetical protein
LAVEVEGPAADATRVRDAVEKLTVVVADTVLRRLVRRPPVGRGRRPRGRLRRRSRLDRRRQNAEGQRSEHAEPERQSVEVLGH